MNLGLDNQLFIVGGATSGFGGAIAERLVLEGANVITVARTAEKLANFAQKYREQVETVTGDITQSATVEAILQKVGNRHLAGALINAGGPPANPAMDSTLEEWDAAYRSVLRWKVDLTKRLMPKFIEQKYGRLVFIESVSVKQPIPNLVLSNSMRMAVVGFVKTLSEEVVQHGVTMNILGPGYHDTSAVDRIFNKKAEQTGKSPSEIKTAFINNLKIGQMGNPADFAELAAWLLSSGSRYVTGQTIIVDGGFMSGVY
ncbi:MAG: SDR family oxidoreductase [Bacteroidota bacterium]